jgi:dynein assembly factor 5
MTETNDTESNQSSSTALNQLLNKFTQGIKEESKIQRKNALEFMLKQLKNYFNQKSAREDIKFTLDSLKVILKLSLSLCNDQAEKCRELANEQIKLILEKSNEWDNDMTTMVLMTLYQRIGGKEIKEPSEEIRLESMNILYDLIDAKSRDAKSVFEIHLQEIVAILINSFNDNYSEVKKKGCLCAKLVANRLASSNFHMQSESLIKPLLANLTHQHSRVRKDIIDCLCDVVMYGNNKSVTDVVSHLAQRLFDQVANVRMAVIKLVGTWLLDLPDRYSFHHRLMPLLLTGFVDESVEIKELTESLWWDVGIKYEKENDEDLKEKSSFLEAEYPNYPVECIFDFN